ncbi:MAG: phage tail tip fiber protein [Methylobacter sp.]
MTDRQVPSVPGGLDPTLRNYLSAVREILNGLPTSIASAVSSASAKTSLDVTTLASLLPGVSPLIKWILDPATPPKPVGFTVTGLFNTMFLHWDYPRFDNYNFTEIYRANALDGSGNLIAVGDINFATDAKLISTSDGNIYSDPVEPGSKYYYWIRFLSMANVAGPYYQSAGVLGETVQDFNAVMAANGWTVNTDSLMDSLITTNKIADFAVDNAKLGNASISATKIGAAAIQTAHIGDLQVTAAKIVSLGVEKLVATTAWINAVDINNAQITSAKIGNTIQSDNYDGTHGWQLSRTGGNVTLNQLTVRDAAGNVILSSGTGIPWSAIPYGSTGRPADGATVGASFGVNIGGQITPYNASTYIAAAAIGTAFIADLGVTTGKIDDLAVNTLKIQDFSVTGQITTTGTTIVIPVLTHVTSLSVVVVWDDQAGAVTNTTPVYITLDGTEISRSISLPSHDSSGTYVGNTVPNGSFGATLDPSVSHTIVKVNGTAGSMTAFASFK